MVLLPPTTATPLGLSIDSIRVPAVFATIEIPVFWDGVPPKTTGTDTDLEVAVTAAVATGVNDGCMNLVSTVTVPFEKTRANPAASVPLLCVLKVTDPKGGIRNEIFGSETASGMRAL